MMEPDNLKMASHDATDATAEPVAESLARPRKPGPVSLSFGVYIGTLTALTLFAGMYMLSAHELRIAAMLFVAGLALGLAGGMVASLSAVAWHHSQGWSADGEASRSAVTGAVLDGVGFGLGILLGSLPISLSCSLLYWMDSFPRVVYIVGGVILMGVGVARAPSLGDLPSAIGRALLPGAVGVFVAHFIGDLLCKRMFFQ